MPKLNSWFSKISLYQRYYLDCGSSLTQRAHTVSGNHDNKLVRLISESEYLPQSCLSEHLPPSRVVFVSVCVSSYISTPNEAFYFKFGPVCLKGLFLSLLGRILWVCLFCVDYKITRCLFKRRVLIFFSHVTPQRCNYIKKYVIRF